MDVYNSISESFKRKFEALFSKNLDIMEEKLQNDIINLDSLKYEYYYIAHKGLFL